MRGEYCETGKLGPLPFGIGDPRPVIPETLYLFWIPVGQGCGAGREGAVAGGVGDVDCWLLTSTLTAGSDWCEEKDGGVKEPVVGAVPLLASLEPSVDRSVLKLFRDRLRISLRFRNEGDIVGPGGFFVHSRGWQNQGGGNAAIGIQYSAPAQADRDDTNEMGQMP